MIPERIDQMWKNFKDAVPAWGIALTFVVSAWNLILTHRSTRHGHFVNFVTSERVKWIQELRGNVSMFCGSIFRWLAVYQTGSPPVGVDPAVVEHLGEIHRLSVLIRLQLNTTELPEKRIEELVVQIPLQLANSNSELAKKSLEELTLATQEVLKIQWGKVKQEVNGRKFKPR
jgi:hypothetical protein